MKFCIQNLENGREDETDVDGLLLVLMMKTNFPMFFPKIEFFSISKPIFKPIFGYKHVET